MNNDKRNMIPVNESKSALILKRELERVLDILETDSIPEKTAIEALRVAFSNYLIECTDHNINKEQKTVLKKNKKSIIWTDVKDKYCSDYTISEDLYNEPANILFFRKMIYEKLVEIVSAEAIHSFVDYLISVGMVMKIEVEEKNYYAFTSKGWSCITSEAVRKNLISIDPSFVYSKHLISSSSEWSETLIYQFYRIHRYYGEDSEYMIFSTENPLTMHYGCKIRDSYSVDYCYAVDSEGIITSEEAAVIYGMCSSDRIDSLTIIIHSKDEESRLKMKYGLDVRKLSKLRFYIMEEDV